MRDTPFKVVIAGGGPAALEAILALGELAPDVDIELITPDADYVHRPLSVLEPFTVPGVRRYPYARLAALGVPVHDASLFEVVPGERFVRTTDGHVFYDALLVVTGAQPAPAPPRALTFSGPDEIERMHGLVQDIEGGYIRRVVFHAPAGASWTLPLYELALQSAERAREMCIDDVQLTVASHEDRPLEAFGPAASELIGSVLQEAGVRFQNGRHEIPSAGRLVVLPALVGRRIAGLPADADGFLPVDRQGRVERTEGVWAAGDGSSFSPIKQGGLATQQAEVAARSIAIAAGCPVDEGAFDPLLRGLLIAGGRSWFMRRRLDGQDTGEITTTPLWSPPRKIAGERLAPFLDALDAERHASPVGRPLQPATMQARAAMTRDPIRVLIAGGGVGGIETALALRAIGQKHLQVDLLAAEPTFTYRPWSVATPFGHGEAMWASALSRDAYAGLMATGARSTPTPACSPTTTWCSRSERGRSRW
jgi:sulfide:quinone oxidoreductase